MTAVPSHLLHKDLRGMKIPYLHPQGSQDYNLMKSKNKTQRLHLGLKIY